MPPTTTSEQNKSGLKHTLSQTIHQVVGSYLQSNFSVADSELPQLLKPLNLESPKNPEFGDFAVNVSSLARITKQAPPQIATALVPELEKALAGMTLTVVAGFINIKLNAEQLTHALENITHTKQLGKNDSLKDTRCLLEFVSANPTGPLHIGHGRWVALGDSLARVMEYSGAKVHKEFYVNDAGSQINNLAISIWFRCLEMLDTEFKFPEPREGEKFPYYPGEYVKDIAHNFLNKTPNFDKICRNFLEDGPHIPIILKNAHFPQNVSILQPFLKYLDLIKKFGMAQVIQEQKELLNNLRLDFDAWFSEKNDLYDKGLVENIVTKLKATGKTYEQDGALWFKTTDYGDDQDRVLKKSDGSYTYLTPDIAYHDEKYTRAENYNLLINIWGADHHGYIPRMKAAIQALGHPVENFEVILGQLVNLKIGGETTRMGKRKKMVTLQELVEEVGVDPVRFWMISKSADTALDFDVDLATSQTNENPVFYAQYAHARCCSILRNALQKPANLSEGDVWEDLTQDEFKNYLTQLKGTELQTWLMQLEETEPNTYAALKSLILKLDSYTEKVQDAARLRAPHIIARYTLDLAAEFHHFYGLCRILVSSKQERLQRLVLINAIQRTLASALELLGVSAPESM